MPSGILTTLRLLRQSSRRSDRYQTVQLYREAAQVDAARALADTMAVKMRLTHLAIASDGMSEGRLIQEAAGVLVAWFSNGRPSGDAALDELEAMFQNLLSFKKSGSRMRQWNEYQRLQRVYRDAWRERLGGDLGPR
jgi:hypothetical protein